MSIVIFIKVSFQYPNISLIKPNEEKSKVESIYMLVIATIFLQDSDYVLYCLL